MILSLSSQHLSAEKLISQAKTSNKPFLVLDCMGRLVAKSKAAMALLKNLRIGRPVAGLAYYSLSDMEEGEIKSLYIQSKAQAVDATVIKGTDGFALLLNEDENGLLQKIQTASGYDIKQVVPIYEAPFEKERRLISDALIQRIKPRHLGVFQSNELLLQIAGSLNAALPKRFNFIFSQAGNFTVSGSDRDFVTLVAYCGVYLSFMAKDSCVDVRIEEKGGFVSLSFFADVALNDQPLVRPLHKINGDFSPDESLFRYIKLLANGNLWDFNVFYENNGLNLCLTLPLAENATDCVIKDIDLEFVSFAVSKVIAEYTD